MNTIPAPKFKKGSFISEKPTSIPALNNIFRIVLIEWDTIMKWLYHCETINREKKIYIFEEDSIDLV